MPNLNQRSLFDNSLFIYFIIFIVVALLTSPPRHPNAANLGNGEMRIHSQFDTVQLNTHCNLQPQEVNRYICKGRIIFALVVLFSSENSSTVILRPVMVHYLPIFLSPFFFFYLIPALNLHFHMLSDSPKNATRCHQSPA